MKKYIAAVLAAVLLLGMLATLFHQIIMATVSQGTQKIIRDSMFRKMQTLPLRYFDTNAAGDIMSRYTGDIDTMRQMISQSIPQSVSAVITLVAVFVAMLIESWILTIVTMITVLAVIFSISSSLLSLYGPKLSGIALDAVDLGEGNVDFSVIWTCKIISNF